MSKICFTFFVFVSLFIVSAYTLNGGVSYTVETARIKAFENVDKKIKIDNYKDFLYDINYEKNMSAIKKSKFKYKGRYLTYFSDKTYSVSYSNSSNICYYYDANGKLEYIGITKGERYPKKGIKYDIEGNLYSTCLIISNKEQFLFDKNKKLIAHWIGNNGYNEKGELFGTRN